MKRHSIYGGHLCMLNITNALLVMIALFNVGLTVFILRGNIQKATNIFLGIYFAALCIWPLALLGSQIGHSYIVWLYSAKLTYIAGLIIAASFYLFSVAFPEDVHPRKSIVLVYGLVLSYAIPILVVPTFLVKGIVPQGGGNAAILEPITYFIFTGIFCFLYLGGLIRIGVKYMHAQGITRTRLLVIGLGAAITGIGGFYYNILLPSPFFNEFRYIWTGPLFSSATAILIVYAVFRLGFLNTKMIVTEFLIALLWIFTLLQTLIATESQERILSGGLFIFSLVVGALLIRGARREIQQRTELKSANEIVYKHSLELARLKKEVESANEKLKELDHLKDEFLSIASHQLRAPITAIRGYVSLLLEGEYGSLAEPMKEPMSRVADSARGMANSIEDYLNISRIEQGRMQYEKSDFDLADLAKRVVNELSQVAKRKGLDLTFNSKGDLVIVNADEGKIKQVITNLVDNAIKYTQNGSVAVSVDKEMNKVKVTVMDTGVGINADEIGTLFEKFKRARDANKINTTGTGLGLYVAKQLTEGHGGKVWAESDGPGQGSRFIVELPV